jgi:hypothetical protein
LNLIHCDHDSDDLHELHACEAENSIILFSLFGALILAIVLYLCFFSRLFQLRLFRACGINKSFDYAQFLFNAEKRLNGKKQPKDAELQKNIIKTKDILSKQIGNATHGGYGKKSLRTSCNRMISCIANSVTSVCRSILNFNRNDAVDLHLPKVELDIQSNVAKRNDVSFYSTNFIIL